MRLDMNVVALSTDRRGRADVDTLVATGLLRAAVCANARLVVEETRLLELTDGLRDLGHGARLRKGIGARAPVPLRRLMHAEIWVAAQVEHKVKVFLARRILTIEVDGTHRAAGDNALMVIFAAIEIDLVAPIDCMFGTRLDACVAARAQL